MNRCPRATWPTPTGCRFCPIIVQEQIPKQVELRVTVVGRRIFAAEIHSQESNRSRLDWRRYNIDATLYGVHELPSEVAARCLAMMDRLGLTFGAFDLILTQRANMCSWRSTRSASGCGSRTSTGLPISQAVCDLLLEGA